MDPGSRLEHGFPDAGRAGEVGDSHWWLGLVGPDYFARRFKAHYGLSATTYRARFAAGAAHLEIPGQVVFPPGDAAHEPGPPPR